MSADTQYADAMVRADADYDLSISQAESLAVAAYKSSDQGPKAEAEYERSMTRACNAASRAYVKATKAAQDAYKRG